MIPGRLETRPLLLCQVPVFTAEAWRCVWSLLPDDLVHAFGVDLAWHVCAGDGGTAAMAVVDEQSVEHLAVPSLGEQGPNSTREHAPWCVPCSRSLHPPLTRCLLSLCRRIVGYHQAERAHAADGRVAHLECTLGGRPAACERARRKLSAARRVTCGVPASSAARPGRWRLSVLVCRTVHMRQNPAPPEAPLCCRATWESCARL